MPVTNGKITAPISANDPYDAMGMGKPADIGYQLNYASSNLHGNINRWAMYKPVRYPQLGDITLAQRKSVNHGIKNVPYFTNILTMANWMRDHSNAGPTNASSMSLGAEEYEGYFGYQPPTGGDYPYRMTDFIDPTDNTRGYYPNAQPFIGAPSDIMETDYNGNLIAEFPLGANDGLSIRLEDLIIEGLVGDLSGYYFGICFTNATRTFFMTQSPSDNVSENGLDGTLAHIHEIGGTITFPSLNSSWTGQYTAFAFVSQYCISTLSQTYNTRCYCVPLTMTQASVQLVRKTVDVVITQALAWRTGGTSLNDRRYLYYTISITNNTEAYTAQTTGSESVAIVYDANGDELTRAVLPQISVQPGQTQTISSQPILMQSNLSAADTVVFEAIFRKSGDLDSILTTARATAVVTTGLPIE